VLLPRVEERSWPGPAKWLLVPAGAAVLAVFALWERAYARRGRTPMADLTLFGVRSYGLGVSLGLVYFAGFTAIFFVTTLFLQQGRGFGPLEAGLAVTPIALGSAVSAALGGRVVTRVGRSVVVAGLLLVLVGLLGTAAVVRWWDAGGLAWAMAPPLLVAGLGSGLVISPNLTLSLSEVPVARAGSAGGVVQTAQRIGTAAGVAAVGSLCFSRLAATGDWSAALAAALLLCAGIVAVALAIAATDVALSRRPRGGRPRETVTTAAVPTADA
jgi:MFS family permease